MSAPAPPADGATPQSAWPVRVIATKLREYIARLHRVWIEGQITEVNRRGGGVVFLTLRDLSTDVSVPVTLSAELDARTTPRPAAGQQVVMHVQCEFWARNGRLVLRAGEIRPVGIGALLATLEQRRAALAAEGLFATIRKRPLPLLPRRIGLITGVNAQAMHDVITNARKRWPAAQFEVREGPVQGPTAVGSMIAKLVELDRDPRVEIIVLARGGGSLEDLLPFSDEALIRAVAAATTPVVSAIGHEQDSPLLDLVADWRASTPTDAGRRIVPDMAEESRRLGDQRARIDRHITTRLRHEQTWLDQTRGRPVLVEPGAWLPRQEAWIRTALERSDRAVRSRLQQEGATLHHLRARAAALSPLATLERGYAVVVAGDGRFVRAAAQLSQGDQVRVRVARGSFRASVVEVDPGPGPGVGNPPGSDIDPAG